MKQLGLVLSIAIACGSLCAADPDKKIKVGIDTYSFEDRAVVEQRLKKYVIFKEALSAVNIAPLLDRLAYKALSRDDIKALAKSHIENNKIQIKPHESLSGKIPDWYFDVLTTVLRCAIVNASNQRHNLESNLPTGAGEGAE